jgi:hypothetical protein
VATLVNLPLDLPTVVTVAEATSVEDSVVASVVVAEASEEAFAAAIVVSAEEVDGVGLATRIAAALVVVVPPLLTLLADRVVVLVAMVEVIEGATVVATVAATTIVAMAMAAAEGTEEEIDQEAADMDVIAASRAAIANLSEAETEDTTTAIDAVTTTMVVHGSDITRATTTIPGSVAVIEHLALLTAWACFHHNPVLLSASAFPRYGWLVSSTLPLVFLASTSAVFLNG